METAGKDSKMAKVVVMNSITLDGVMQAPAGPTRTPAMGSRTRLGDPGGDELDVAKMGDRMI